MLVFPLKEMEECVIGCDEAGRGPVVGPMVVAGVKLLKKDEETLKGKGVRDSKLLSPRKREELRREIENVAKKIKLVVISAKQLDQMMQVMSLNEIEMNAMAQIIDDLDCNAVILDLPSNSPSFVPELKSKLKNKNVKIKAEHKADTNYIVVGAASIMAKTERDAAVKEIEKKYGDLGSGYPSDPRTVQFLKDYYERHGNLPDVVRHSWGTVANLTGETFARSGMEKKKGKQVNLFDY